MSVKPLTAKPLPSPTIDQSHSAAKQISCLLDVFAFASALAAFGPMHTAATAWFQRTNHLGGSKMIKIGIWLHPSLPEKDQERKLTPREKGSLC